MINVDYLWIPNNQSELLLIEMLELKLLNVLVRTC